MDLENFAEEGAPVFTEELQASRVLREAAKTKTAITNQDYFVTQQNELSGYSMAPSVKLTSPALENCKCEPVSIAAFLKRNNKNGKGLSYSGAYCQICLFEGRGMLTRHVIIGEHDVRSCSISRDEHQTNLSKRFFLSKEPWICRNRSATCLEKLHHFIFQLGCLVHVQY